LVSIATITDQHFFTGLNSFQNGKSFGHRSVQTALEISFDNPGLHRNLSGSFEDEDDDEYEGFMLIPSDQDA
jgi:hypothetical protein